MDSIPETKAVLIVAEQQEKEIKKRKLLEFAVGKGGIWKLLLS